MITSKFKKPKININKLRDNWIKFFKELKKKEKSIKENGEKSYKRCTNCNQFTSIEYFSCFYCGKPLKKRNQI